MNYKGNIFSKFMNKNCKSSHTIYLCFFVFSVIPGISDVTGTFREIVTNSGQATGIAFLFVPGT